MGAVVALATARLEGTVSEYTAAYLKKDLADPARAATMIRYIITHGIT